MRSSPHTQGNESTLYQLTFAQEDYRLGFLKDGISHEQSWWVGPNMFDPREYRDFAK